MFVITNRLPRQKISIFFNNVSEYRTLPDSVYSGKRYDDNHNPCPKVMADMIRIKTCFDGMSRECVLGLLVKGARPAKCETVYDTQLVMFVARENMSLGLVIYMRGWGYFRLKRTVK